MGITLEKVEGIAERLNKMPESENKNRSLSKQEAIKVLSKEITSLQKKGYTIEQIADTLRGEGLNIATATLKNYLHRSKKKAKIPKEKPTKLKEKDTSLSPRVGAISSTEKKKSSFTTRNDTEEI